MADCCLIKKVATVEVYENKNEVRAYGFMAGDRNTPVMEVRFKHLWGESNLSSCKLRWIIVDDVGSLLVGEVPIQSDNTALINLPNELFTGDRRMKVQLTVASCDGERILNLQQFTDLKVINSLAPNEVVQPVYQLLINQLYDDTKVYLSQLETSYSAKYGSLETLYANSKASLEQYLVTAENGGNAEFLQGYAPHNFKKTEDTIANLKASTKYKLGEVVEVLGYYSIGDGAGHKRKIEATDDGSGVQLANGLYANIVHNGEVNVSWFGAKGDGVTDSSDILQKALEYGSLYDVHELYTVKGLFLVNKPISLFRYRQDGTNKQIKIKTPGSEYNNAIIANTGGVLINSINSHHVVFELNIISTLCKNYNRLKPEYVINESLRKGCTIAYNVSRAKNADNSWGSSHTHTFCGGRVLLEDDLTYNNGYGSIVVYNDTCEITTYRDFWFRANTPVVITKNDLLGINPLNNYKLSCKDHYFTDKCVFESYGNGSANIVIDGVENLYLNGYGHAITDSEMNTYIRVVSHLNNFTINADVEKVSRFISGGIVSYGKMNILGIGYRKIIDNVELRHVEVIENCYKKDSVESLIYVDGAGSIANSILNFKYLAAHDKQVVKTTGTVYGLTIKTANPQRSVSSQVTVDVPNNTGYTIVSSYGEYVDGKRVMEWYWGVPTDIDYQEKQLGSVFVNMSREITGMNGYPAISINNGMGYTTIGQHGYRSFADMSTVTPRFIGEIAIENGKIVIGVGLTQGAWSNRVSITLLDTPYHTLKMQQEGVYEDFIQYMDSKTEYDRLQREAEQQRQSVFENRENQEQTYEEWLAEQPMLLPVIEEPQPSEKLLAFKEKYLG